MEDLEAMEDMEDTIEDMEGTMKDMGEDSVIEIITEVMDFTDSAEILWPNIWNWLWSFDCSSLGKQ